MKIEVQECPYCKKNEFIEAWQGGNSSVTSGFARSAKLCHTICKNCGSVVRSYVVNPEDLMKFKDRTSW